MQSRISVTGGTWYRGLEIYIGYESGGKLYLAKSVELQFEEYDPQAGIQCDPTLQIDEILGHEFLKAVSDFMHTKGIHTESESKLEGKLVATEHHLADMRDIMHKLLDIGGSEPSA